MIIRLLGPHGVVPLKGAGQRTLVARLAMRPGETVNRNALVDALWSDQTPPTATKTLHSLLAHLRREIRQAGLGDLITTRDPGYVLTAPAEAVDAVRFESLAARGRDALPRDPQIAAAKLRAALELWTGDPLEDCRQCEWARHESGGWSSLPSTLGAELAIVTETDDDLAAVRSGEALSSVLLAAAVWGLSSHVRLEDRLIVRVG